ncbi:hypothetical protein [uncultured Megasphaera sp.]|uniref:hypothetical protein n=1 Tax=uncultured Megasphaera sp. TaxID=165188 RepID=UPI0025976AC0|nr:hypothetical protein [uncultured Megasphaera sp.]
MAYQNIENVQKKIEAKKKDIQQKKSIQPESHSTVEDSILLLRNSMAKYKLQWERKVQKEKTEIQTSKAFSERMAVTLEELNNIDYEFKKKQSKISKELGKRNLEVHAKIQQIEKEAEDQRKNLIGKKKNIEAKLKLKGIFIL